MTCFSQHALHHRKVAFMPPMEDIGPEMLLVQFVLSVSDQHGGTVSGVTFNISVTPVDDEAPEVTPSLCVGGPAVMKSFMFVQEKLDG